MTTRIMFLYNNLVDSATLTESSEADGYPAENVQNRLRTKVWRTAGATEGTADLVIDFGSAQSVTAIALTGYNWTSAPGTLDVEFNAADAWGAPAETKALTWAATPTANGNKATIVVVFASISYRYARLNVVYSPAATPTDWDLGRIFIGEFFQPEKGYRRRHGIGLVDPSMSVRTVGGQRYTDEIEKHRTADLSFNVKTQAQWELFQKMFNSVGKSKDLFAVLDYDSEPDEMTLYGAFQNLPLMTRDALYDFSVTLQEST